ncbi:MAG TPA: hypothetical protein VGO46_15020 [Gemmatimonadaceae bacterium]|nr:hypothetical protein [Gemmatimonadaceae bacterium]
MSSSERALPDWLPGVWTRDWIERKGARSDLFEIHYLQTPTAFGDMRVPRNRPSFAHAASFAGLSDPELMVLAKQRGFAGYATIDGEIATWHHEIDFQPPDTGVDAGRLERIDDAHMYEHALDSSYTESWTSTSTGDGRYLALIEEHAGRPQRVLLIAGDRFLYVRNRERDLPAAESIDSLVSESRATRAQIIKFLDCEFSFGRVRGGVAPWSIERSTLPWREGKHLDYADELVATNDGSSVARHNQSSDVLVVKVNTFAKKDLLALFASDR